MEANNETKFSATRVFGGFFLVSMFGLIVWAIYNFATKGNVLGDIKMPSGNKSDGDKSTAEIDEKTSEVAIKNPITEVVDIIKGNSIPGFPLKQVYGADLHKANPYVMDVQQALNKFYGARLDIDGAFGKNTALAIKKAFGHEEVDVQLYNTMARALGKPTLG